MKYILVTGGVISGLGKGVCTSSIGRLLKSCNINVTTIKIDPYLNIDAGTMSPYEHGEVFVLKDGGEVDLDLGNYERFLDIQLTKDHNITTGKIYQQVINRERKGDYLGRTVQVVPHITDTIKEWIQKVAHIPVTNSNEVIDVCLIELGGTVGDIESMIFLEALRQLKVDNNDNFCHIHVSLVPVTNEQKSKPTQHGVKKLREVGLIPDFIFCRCVEPVNTSVKKKISLFCMVPTNHVISMHDVKTVYIVPQLFSEQNVTELILKKLSIQTEVISDFGEWGKIISAPVYKDKVTIAIVGKYVGSKDAYLSLTKALIHSSFYHHVELKIQWIDATNLSNKNRSAWNILKRCDGVLVPGGFGSRGCEGKIKAVQYARENKVPYLGICLGFQLAVIEYSRNILNIKDANSEEFSHNKKDVIIFMPDISTDKMGGTMRLGAHNTHLLKSTIAYNIYQSTKISERHRHRYEVNPEYIKVITDSGMLFTGTDSTGKRMEFMEIPETSHPCFIGTQYHPEFQSTPIKPSPVFCYFVSKAKKKLSNL